MADEVKRLDPNHLVTVGMAHYINLYQPGPDGRRVVDYSDVISFHNYNAPDTLRQLEEIRKHTWKPILLQEFGWPSGPPCTVPEYNETQQEAVYREMLSAADGRVAGVIAWTLRDFDAGPTMRWDTREEYYGLYRPDDTLKPAALAFQAYAAPPLPSSTTTNLELTSRYHHIEGSKSPKLIGEHYIKGWFRRAWDYLGGEGSFGLPISEAYEDPHSGRVVQHFTAATLEFYPEAEYLVPGFDSLPMAAKTMQMIRPAGIGNYYTEGITFPPQQPITPAPDAQLFPETGYVVKGKFLEFYYNMLGPWRLGMPISPEVVENIGGVDVTIQYFERGRLEFHPGYNVVQFGQIGLPLWEKQCRFER
jgi:hypothetical protein